MKPWLDLLGPMAWPLIVCSSVMLALILERLAFFVSLSRFPDWQQRKIVQLADAQHWHELRTLVHKSPTLSATATRMMLVYRQYPHPLIEDIAALWLVKQKNAFQAHLTWFSVLATAAPLIGLLGTVLGIIEAFKAIASTGEIVTPALLADGLQQAMLTTAFGLSIAIPALIAGYGFRIWGSAYLQSLENLINHLLIALQSVDTIDDTNSQAPDNSSSTPTEHCP